MNEMVFYDENVSHVNPGQVAQPGVPFPNRFCGMSPALEDGNFNEKILQPSPADLVQYSFLFDSESQDVVPKDYSCSNFNYQPDQSDASWDDGKLISTPEEDEATLWELMDKSQLRFLSFFDYGEIIRELHVFKLANPQMPIEGFLEFAEANGELLFSLGKKNFFITLNYEEFLSRHRPSGEFIIETAPSATSEVNLSKFELCNASYTPSEKATTFPPNDIDSEGVLLPWQAPLAGWGGEKVSEDIQLILDKEWEVGRFKHLKKARAIERKRPNNKIEWRPVTLASAMGVTSRGSPIVESLVGQLNMRAQRAWKRRSAEAIAREKKMSASVHVRQTEKCTRGKRRVL